MYKCVYFADHSVDITWCYGMKRIRNDAVSGCIRDEDVNIKHKHANIMQFKSIINSIRKQWMSYLVYVNECACRIFLR